MTRLIHVLPISIHAAREGGDVQQPDCKLAGNISIHAAREGGDQAEQLKKAELAISIHAAREGGDFD